MSSSTSPLVHILLATCNGEAYLERQLKSIEQQSYTHWVLHASDDGSNDKTRKLIDDFKKRLERANMCEQVAEQLAKRGLERVHLHMGPQRGSTVNFMHLVSMVARDKRINSGDLFSFADQDDVWLAEKLERAVAWHVGELHCKSTLNQRPMLYAAKTYLVDEDLRPLGLSKTPKVPLDYKSALVENVLSGNTMVMNAALIQILSRMHWDHSVWHDWSAYLVAACCEGALFYDERPCVLYRQHAKNVIGVRVGWLEQWRRARTVLKGRYSSWTQINLNGLQDIESSLSIQAFQAIECYQTVRKQKSVWTRLLKVRHLSVQRQSKFLQVVLYVSLVLGWI